MGSIVIVIYRETFLLTAALTAKLKLRVCYFDQHAPAGPEPVFMANYCKPNPERDIRSIHLAPETYGDELSMNHLKILTCFKNSLP